MLPPHITQSLPHVGSLTCMSMIGAKKNSLPTEQLVAALELIAGFRKN